MPHCTPCGAPSYSDPCASCRGKARDALERGEPAPYTPATQAAQPVAPQPNQMSYEISDFPRWRAFMEQYTALREGVAGAANFSPNEWQMLLETVADLARHGLGQPVKLPPPAAPPPAPSAPQAAPEGQPETQSPTTAPAPPAAPQGE